jgi:hypothetical protein
MAQQTRIMQKIANAVAPDPSHEPFIKKFKDFYKLKPFTAIPLTMPRTQSRQMTGYSE